MGADKENKTSNEESKEVSESETSEIQKKKESHKTHH